jgi:CHAD domain-containing protein
MAVSSKWLVIDRGDAPVARVAARTLRKRLHAVWTILPLACEPAGDPEQVHQLRVATRRALAAFEAFDRLIPGKRRQWFSKWLRRLRRAAGDARDLDVLTDRLLLEREARRQETQPLMARSANARSARGRLVAMLSRQRAVSRQPIRDVCERLREAEWPRRVEQLLDRVAARAPGRRFADYARRRFRPIVGRFFASADRKMRSAEELHAFRIEGKKVRYVLEIFGSVFSPDVRRRCADALEQLQETLGEFTDHSAAADRFRRWSREASVATHRDALGRLRREEEDRADAARKAFSRWWNQRRRAALRRTFDRTLRRQTA